MVVEWIELTPRQIELILWQLIENEGGEIDAIIPEDLPGRCVMFYRGDASFIVGAIAEKDND
jgi:hypothetical protein